MKLLSLSLTLKSMFEEDGFNFDEFIELKEITKETFEKVLVYLEHIEAGNAVPDINKPVRSSDMRENTSKFYANFVDLDNDHVQDLILAANYLDIKSLLDLSIAKMASIIRDLSIPQFRVILGIVNDFTPEEEAEPFDEAKLAELAEAYE